LGRTAVEIRSVKSSCGCTTPTVEPTAIAPGATGRVEARATPLQVGEKTATIKVVTNSTITPEILLQLKIIGSRRPPFMGTAGGDLAFLGDDLTGQVRKIYITTMEMDRSEPKPPRVSTTLPYLILGPAKLVDEQSRPDGSGVTARRYIVEAKLGPNHPGGSFEGDVFVVDPWDDRNRERVRVHGETLAPLRIVPARLVLHVNPTTGKLTSSAKLLVLSSAEISDLTVGWDGTDRPSLLIDPPSLSQTKRAATVVMASEAGEVKAGEYRIQIRSASSGSKVTVPVSIRREDQP
jgi:hypothetical protein